VKTGSPGLGEQGLPTTRPVPGRNLIQRTKQGHGTFAVTDHIGNPLLLHTMKVGTQFGFQFTRLYFHVTKLVI
jgi:hypothetical protein